jgi:hypothetical protein
MAKNLIYREVDEINSQFIIEGEPHHRQRTDTYIQQKIRCLYRAPSEVGIDLWTELGITAHLESDDAFIPFGTKYASDDKLPLNRTFKNVRYQPVGCDGKIEWTTNWRFVNLSQPKAKEIN